jgi:hypothetical protein
VHLRDGEWIQYRLRRRRHRDKRHPVEIVAERFEDELAPEDEAVRAGYPDEGGDPTIAIRREGRTVVAVHLFGNDKEGYLIDSEDICGDFRP